MQFVPILGYATFLFLVWLSSNNKKKINWSIVAWGSALQLILGILVLGIPFIGFQGPLRGLFDSINSAVVGLLGYTDQGSKFLFGSLMNTESMGFIFAFQVLPTIIFFSALTSILYHLKILQFIVKGIAWIMQRTLGTSGAETLSAAANIFVGQTEAPLVVKPYIEKMTKSELFVVMVGGMATVAGGVLAAYVKFLQDRIPDIAGHLVTASLMSAPAALLVAKMMIPETETPETLGDAKINIDSNDSNVIEAAANGAGEGLKLALNVAAMLLVFVALIALANGLFAMIGDLIGFSNWGKNLTFAEGSPEITQLSVEWIMGWIFAPFAFLMGVPWSEAPLIGSLIGQKVVLNEFIAYLNLSSLKAQLSDRALIIASYALCGFANFSSIGIQIGGIGGLAPNRKSDLAALGLKAVFGGTIAAFLTACMAGLLIE